MILTLIISSLNLYPQEYSSVCGTLADYQSKEAIPYANIGLFTEPDLKLVTGQVSDSSGYFQFKHIPAGKYLMRISMMGYEELAKMVDVSVRSYDAGIILLNTKLTGIGETVVTADRLKGKSDKDKTIYYVTKKMTDVSSNGLDLIKHVPGVQLDFKRNISLEGSQNILILVDGIERDNNFVSQINPESIDRIEILSAPPSKYDGNITGVISIVLKKQKNLGISGRTNLEIPGGSIYFIHPDYGINIGLRKINIYTSYNGEMISFDQHEGLRQEYQVDGETVKSKSDQNVRQKLGSHRFHYGFDFPLTSKSHLNIYGFFNPYSQKYSGLMESVSDRNPEPWRATRVSADNSRSTCYSLFFKHMFNNKGNDLSLDITNYHYSGEYSATYASLLSEPALPSIINESRPDLNALSIKIDMNAGLSQNLSLSTGAKLKLQTMRELYHKDFKYTESTYAAYVSLGYNRSRLDISSGIRIEKSISELKDAFSNHEISLLPFAMLSFKMSSDKTFKIGINRIQYRPNLYQLNPVISMDDPNNIRQGNPYLSPEMRTTVFVEYSKKYKTNYVSSRFFYNHNTNVISNLSFVNDSSMVETRSNNAGSSFQSGLQISGTFKIGRSVSFIPYLRLYSNYCSANSLAKKYSVDDSHQLVFEPGFSSIISFKHDINLSLVFQYASPRNSIQAGSFSDPLYTVSLDKLFKKVLRAGIAGALPFTSTFTYQGSEIRDRGLHSQYTGEICLSYPLFWFKLSYQFNTGRKLDKTGRTVDEGDLLPRKGL